jgi:threonyl-tRNA synthetase
LQYLTLCLCAKAAEYISFFSIFAFQNLKTICKVQKRMIKVTFPDGSVREFAKGITGLQLAESISSRLAQEVLAITVNDQIWDLTRPIETDAAIKLHKWEDEEAKHAFWHSSAHLMAEALQELYPGIKFGIGPAIENGFYYDVDPGEVSIKESDLPAIEAKMLELAARKEAIVRSDISKADALKRFGDIGEVYKTEMINDLADGTITLYTQGNFTDLCRGPHLPNTGDIKAIKVLSVAGAYWRGDEKRKMLTRLYGITFPKKKMLDEYLVLLEEAKKRDHRKIGKELELFMFSEMVGKGLPMWLPRGTSLRLRLEDFLKKIQRRFDYQQVMTPHIGNKQLYVTSGHYAKYGKDSFQPIHTPEEGEEYLLKPMNCPHHCEIYKFKPRSYKELPVRIAEFGTVYRYEQSGELHGLTRVRSFTQDDAHIFCRPDQVKDEFLKVMDIIFIIFNALEFENFEAQISLRDPNNREKYIGSDENWDKAEQSIIEACAEKGLKAKVETGEAAFYGPKLDFMVRDAIGRKWQLGTIQVDYNLPERFELEYTGEDNAKHRPVMIHRAPFGSMERFVAVLIEHTAGKFPLWLTPDQVVVLPISEKFNDYAFQIAKEMNSQDIRVTVDDRNEKIGRKIRDNELKRIPYMLIVGEKEAENGEVSVRRQGEGDKGTMKVAEFIKLITEEVDALVNQYNK